MRIEAFAKINLSLEVLGQRPDGFHDLVSVLQTVTLSDTLEFKASSNVTLSCSDDQLSNTQNLAIRAAHLLKDQAEVTEGCDITLTKRIPVSAGLGGGSSDAAACLRALVDFWHLASDCTCLHGLAEKLGSDIPFFLHGGTALIEGRGERVSVLPRPTPVWLLLAKPPMEVSTAAIFRGLPHSDWSDGSTTRRVADSVRQQGTVSTGINGLQETLFRLYPIARQCFQDVHVTAPGRTLVSGSGPTVCAVFASKDEAEGALRSLASLPYWMSIASTHTPEGLPCP